jgi:hypothetical protein
MPTAAFCGDGGSIAGASGTEIVEWNIDLTVDVIDGTSMGSNGWKEKISCLRGGTGNFICIGERPTIGKTAGNATFTDKAGGADIVGVIWISDVQHTTPVADRVAFDAKFTFTDTITAAGLI